MKTIPMIAFVGALTALAAASSQAAKPGEHSFTIEAGGSQRRYTVHVPPRYDGHAPMPVVIMLHGGGGTGKAAATETGWGAKAGKEGFLAVFPDALARDPSRPSSFARNPQLWNDGSDRFYDDRKAPDDVAFIEAILDKLPMDYAVDARRIYLTGFSNGASMAFRVGVELSRRIAAIAPVAGACWIETVRLERAIPMVYLTGTADPLNLIEGGVPKLANGGRDPVRAKPKPPVRDTIMKWVRSVGASATPRTTTASNGVHTETYGPGRDGAEVIYVSVEGLGHMWAGGKSLLPAYMVGPRSDKIKATDLIWDFFQTRTMAVPEPAISPAPATVGEALRRIGAHRSRIVF